MIYCDNCGLANRDGSRFCNECGHLLGEWMRCARCGFANPSTGRFCNQCGDRLHADQGLDRGRASVPITADKVIVVPEPSRPAPPQVVIVEPPSEEEGPLEYEAPSLSELIGTLAHQTQASEPPATIPPAAAQIETGVADVLAGDDSLLEDDWLPLEIEELDTVELKLPENIVAVGPDHPIAGEDTVRQTLTLPPVASLDVDDCGESLPEIGDLFGEWPVMLGAGPAIEDRAPASSATSEETDFTSVDAGTTEPLHPTPLASPSGAGSHLDLPNWLDDSTGVAPAAPPPAIEPVILAVEPAAQSAIVAGTPVAPGITLARSAREALTVGTVPASTVSPVTSQAQGPAAKTARHEVAATDREPSKGGRRTTVLLVLALILIMLAVAGALAYTYGMPQLHLPRAPFGIQIR